MRIRPFSLRARLGLGAGLIGLVAVAASALTIYGMAQTSARIDDALAAERRIERYSVLSTQITSFIVVTVEALQSGVPAEMRAARLDRLTEDIGRTFGQIRRDLEWAVDQARTLGLDAQSRRATQSLGIARMEALFNGTADRVRAIEGPAARETVQGHVDAFSTGFDPLLNAVITDEIRARNQIITGIAGLRDRLTVMALAIAAAALGLFAAFYLALLRPQLRRLDQLRAASRRIGAGDFDIALPAGRQDEIGALFSETARMAQALAARRAEVDAEWDRLTDTVAARTQELRQANTRLAQADEDRRRFFADISHELRTPLTVILMEAELGRHGKGTD
ncbi:hypothetical protein LCGC14_2782290, partial [marine sediment metagenome]